jgi:hypothetical protein
MEIKPLKEVLPAGEEQAKEALDTLFTRGRAPDDPEFNRQADAMHAWLKKVLAAQYAAEREQEIG